MHAHVLYDSPAQTLEATRLLLGYFAEREERITIPARALRRASRLLKLMGCYNPAEHSMTWKRAREWRSRLELAGLDPDTLEIIDQYRWDLAWEQLTRTRTFRDDIQRKAIALGLTAPKAEPYIRGLQLPESGKNKSPDVKRSLADYLSSDKKAKLRGRSKRK